MRFRTVRVGGDGWQPGASRAWAGLLAAVLFVAGAVVPAGGEDPPKRKEIQYPSLSKPLPRLSQPARPAAGAALRAGYVKALGALAGGDRSGAIDLVVQLELRGGENVAPSDAERCLRVGRALANRMAELDRESLVPMIALRQELYGEYRRRGVPLLSLVSGNLAIATAELYASEPAEDAARALASGVVATFGCVEQAGGSLQRAREVFERALQLDAASAPALMGLGAHFELLGRYDLAAAHFSRVHAAHPDELEGALRLGVNLGRLKRWEHALPLLRACSEQAESDWIAAVASEELGRSLLAAGRGGEASAALERAIARFPGDGALRVLLAFVLDQSRDTVAARAVIEAASGLPAAADESPRLRYCRWPSGAAGRAREDLERAAAERRPVLARVAAALSTEGA